MRKFTAMFLVFSILALSGNMFTKVRRGAELVITKKDGQQTMGELIAVKKNSFLLKESESGVDTTVNIKEVKVVQVVRKSETLKWGGIGLLIGASMRATGPMGLNIMFVKKPGERTLNSSKKYAAILGAVGLATGVIFSAVAETDKTIQFEGRSDAQIQEILGKLRKRARVKNFQ